MLCTKNLQQNDFDTFGPWNNILSSVMEVIYGTHCSTLEASPAQLVFDQDILLNGKFIAGWEIIRLRK